VIIDAYYEDMKDKIENLKKEDITFEFFIEINGAYAVRIDVGWLYQCAPSKETVDGVEFNYPYGPVSSYGIKYITKVSSTDSVRRLTQV
ncbi:MAG: hypothetical protein IJY94_02295, partial [Clostridia bacterium]|nr:hypothetical protein [Clostridia bacterium]